MCNMTLAAQQLCGMAKKGEAIYIQVVRWHELAERGIKKWEREESFGLNMSMICCMDC